MTIAPLAASSDASTFGGKAASLSRAIAAGLPVPDGFAIGWQSVHDEGAILAAWRGLGATRVAVRSSAIGEDSQDASFAGQHTTILNVDTEQHLLGAVATVRASAESDHAHAYRARMSVDGAPRIAIVVQKMVDAEVAGVLFTRNPLTGAQERVIESSWGLGEVVVAGLVNPDRFRVSIDGRIVERTAGRKDIVIRRHGEEEVPLEDWTRLSLSDTQLFALHELAGKCERLFGGPQDLEWAFEGERLALLQSRPITTSKPPEETEIERLTPRRFAGLALAALLAPLNSTIIAVALPSIAGAFAASPATVTRWLVTAYLFVTILAQSPSGKLADVWGASRVLTLGRTMFGLGAVLAAFSPSLAMLAVGRALMAIGGAFTIPTVFAFLRRGVPPEKRGRMFGLFGAIMSGAAAAGPILGGLLTERYGWHSVFIVNIPVVLLSFLLEPPSARAAKAEGRGGFDFGLFRHRPFAAGTAIIALQNLAMYAMLFLLPFVLARGGSSASQTGRVMLLFTLSMVLASPLGGRLADAIGARIVTVAGSLIATAGASLFVSGENLIAAVILTGAGIGLSTGPSQAAGLSSIPAQQAGVASGVLSTMRYVGGIIGSGLVALLAASNNPHDPRLLVFPAVLLASAVVALALHSSE